MEHIQTSLSLQEVSQRLNRPIEFLKQEIKYGNLPAYKCGKKNKTVRIGYVDFCEYVLRSESRKYELKGVK